MAGFCFDTYKYYQSPTSMPPTSADTGNAIKIEVSALHPLPIHRFLVIVELVSSSTQAAASCSTTL